MERGGEANVEEVVGMLVVMLIFSILISFFFDLADEGELNR